MFVTQQELLKRLNISHPTHNRLRRAGVLPEPFPDTGKYFWPQVIEALEKASGVKLDLYGSRAVGEVDSMSIRDYAVDNAIAGATLSLLIDMWPECFRLSPAARRPLQIGIHNHVLAVAGGAITPKELTLALRGYVHNLAYLRGMQEGAPRIDLYGNPAGAVTAEEAAIARAKIERIRVRASARASARVRAHGLAVRAAADEAKRGAKGSGFEALRRAAAARKTASVSA
jgi:sRNA-binding protein